VKKHKQFVIILLKPQSNAILKLLKCSKHNFLNLYRPTVELQMRHLKYKFVKNNSKGLLAHVVKICNISESHQLLYLNANDWVI